MWEDESENTRQLFQYVDSTWNDEGTIFGWHPQFGYQVHIVMIGLLLYLKLLYGNTIESYFSPGTVGIQSKQRWDKCKGGSIGEDDDFISSISAEDSWWDDKEVKNETGSKRMVAIDGTQQVAINAKNVVSRDVLDADNDDSQPSLNTKANETGGMSSQGMYDFLHASPPTRCVIIINNSTISINLTMDTMTDRVKSEICGLDNSVNRMAHMLKTFMRELRQERRQDKNSALSQYAPTQGVNSTKVTEDEALGGQSK